LHGSTPNGFFLRYILFYGSAEFETAKKKSAANPKEELGNNWNFNLG
jgi:hypothetical protein